MTGLFQDVRYGVRQLIARPAFTVVAVSAVALGVGASTAIFSVVNALLLRPLPYERSDRLVMLWRGSETSGMLVYPGGELLEAWRGAQRSFESVEAFTTGGELTLRGEDGARTVAGAFVSHGYFNAIRLAPAAGRTFVAADEISGAPSVVILGHAFWRAAFAGDPGVVGRQVVLDDAAYTVVGVAAASAALPFGREREPDVWLPLRRGATGAYEARAVAALGRLREGATIEGAREELEPATESMVSPAEALRVPALRRPQDMLPGEVGRTLVLLMGAVGLVLLIACANVANLLLARSAGREKELAVRRALGAGRFRLLRQLLVESLLVAMAGGALGMLAAYWAIDVIAAVRPESLRELERVRIDARVLSFAAALTIATGLLFGVLPAVRTVGRAVAGTLRSTSGAVGDRRGNRLSRTLIATEVALSIVLMVGALLLVRTLVSLQRQPLGFEPDGLVIASFRLPSDTYADAGARDALLERARAAAALLPGVDSALRVVTTPPAYGISFGPLEIEGRVLRDDERPELLVAAWAGPAYFDMLGIGIVRGRAFTESDEGAADRVIVNESFARRFFPAGDAVGHRIRQEADAAWMEIVGVAADLPAQGLMTSDQARYQLHMPNDDAAVPRTELLIRTALPPSVLREALRAALARTDPAIAVQRLETVRGLLADTLDRPRFNVVLLGTLAALALLLSAVGLYGVVGYAVSRRTREIGIRRALGAQRGDVLRLVVAEALAPAAAGTAIGIAGALFVTRLMTGLLHGVSPRDPVTLLAVPVVLGVVAATASLAPARRATRIEPASALRWER